MAASLRATYNPSPLRVPANLPHTSPDTAPDGSKRRSMSTMSLVDEEVSSNGRGSADTKDDMEVVVG